MKLFSRSPEKEKIYYYKETRRGENLIIENRVRRSGEYYYTQDIIWRSAKGEEVNFNDFLPNKKWSFLKKPFIEKEGARYGYLISEEGKRYIEYGDLSQSSALLSLLHEIGHAHIWERTKEKELEEARLSFMSYTRDLEKRLLTEEDIKRKGENPKDYVYVTVFDPMGKEGAEWVEPEDQFFQILIPRKLVEKRGQELARVERDAWAYAWKTLRQLKKKGLILEPDFKLADFKSKIYSYLESYEKHFKKKLKTRGKYFTKGKKFKRIKLN